MTRSRIRKLRTQQDLDAHLELMVEQAANSFAKLNTLLPSDVTHPYNPVGSAIHSGLGSLISVQHVLKSDLRNALPAGDVSRTSGRLRHDDPLPWRVISSLDGSTLRASRRPRGAAAVYSYDPRPEYALPQGERVNALLELFRREAERSEKPVSELAGKWLRVTDFQRRGTRSVQVQVPLGDTVRMLSRPITEVLHLRRVLTLLALPR